VNDYFPDSLFERYAIQSLAADPRCRGFHVDRQRTWLVEEVGRAARTRPEDSSKKAPKATFLDTSSAAVAWPSADREVDAYLAAELHYEKDPFEWWNLNFHKYPNVADVVRPYLALPPSITKCESTFSVGGWLVAPRRATLSIANLQASLIIHMHHAPLLRAERERLQLERQDARLQKEVQKETAERVSAAEGAPAAAEEDDEDQGSLSTSSDEDGSDVSTVILDDGETMAAAQGHGDPG
jgi:hypothetical protein